MKQPLALLAAALLLAGAPAARAVEYKTLEDFALASFDTCGKVVSEGVAADPAFKAMGYDPGPGADSWLIKGDGWLSYVVLHSGPVSDGRTYTQCVTTFTPPPTDQVAFNAEFLSRVVASGLGVEGRVSHEGPQTITSYADIKHGLVLNIASSPGKGGNDPATATLSYSILRP